MVEVMPMQMKSATALEIARVAREDMVSKGH